MIDLQNKSPNILVIGDLMIDHCLWGSSERISPEAPVPVVNVDIESNVLGGAGNVINNLKALGAMVDVISVIGECETSKELKDLLRDIKIETQYARAVQGGTGFAKAAGNYAAALYPAKLGQDKGYTQLIWTDAKEHKYIEEAGTMNIIFNIFISLFLSRYHSK